MKESLKTSLKSISGWPNYNESFPSYSQSKVIYWPAWRGWSKAGPLGILMMVWKFGKQLCLRNEKKLLFWKKEKIGQWLPIYRLEKFVSSTSRKRIDFCMCKIFSEKIFKIRLKSQKHFKSNWIIRQSN